MSILKANRIENLTTTDGGINVNNSGNVGIGTTSPARPLSVLSSQISARFTSSSSDSQIEVVDSSGTVVYGSASGNAIIQAGGSERLRIDSSGRVGIGTSSPSSLIHGSSSGNAALTLQTSGSSNSVSTNYQSANRTYYTCLLYTSPSPRD